MSNVPVKQNLVNPYTTTWHEFIYYLGSISISL